MWKTDYEAWNQVLDNVPKEHHEFLIKPLNNGEESIAHRLIRETFVDPSVIVPLTNFLAKAQWSHPNNQYSEEVRRDLCEFFLALGQANASRMSYEEQRGFVNTAKILFVHGVPWERENGYTLFDVVENFSRYGKIQAMNEIQRYFEKMKDEPFKEIAINYYHKTVFPAIKAVQENSWNPMSSSVGSLENTFKQRREALEKYSSQNAATMEEELPKGVINKFKNLFKLK